MTSQSLANKSVAMLVCSGFTEAGFIALHKALVGASAKLTIVSRDSGLINGWSDNGWGLSWPADQAMNETLAVDFDMLVIPDGSRHSELVKNDAHGRRIINAFLREEMPALVLGSGIDLLEAFDLAENRNISREAVCRDGTLVTAGADADIASLLDSLGAAVNEYSQNAAAA